MSSKTVSVPKCRHHRGSGQAFVQIKGRRHYLGKWDTPESKERYSRFVAELAANAVLAVPPATEGLAVVEVADAYWRFCQGYYRKKDGTPIGWLLEEAHRVFGIAI